MADTLPSRVRQAIADPGSITTRQPAEPKDDGLPELTVEPLVRWQTRAALIVFSEHWTAREDAPTGHPIGAALLIAFNSLATLVAGLWIGSVWL